MNKQQRSLTPAMEDYLRAMHDLSQREKPVHTTSLARYLDVAPASVTGMLKRLATMGLVDHERYGGAELTPAGERVAVQVIRHHRLIETYLAEAMGVGWDEVHGEAHRLEHHISPDLGERIDELLGHPDRDPHGSPIPPRDGPFVVKRFPSLSRAEVGSRVIVREVLDEDGAFLRELAAIGIRPDAELVVLSPADGGPMTVEVAGRSHSIGGELTEAVFVEPVAE